MNDDIFFIPELQLLLDQECDGDGATGMYYQISNSVGIKVILGDCKKLKDLKKNGIWRQAKKEFDNTKKAHKILGEYSPGVIKLTYAVQTIDQQKYYHPVIIMDHLDSNTEFDEEKNYDLLGTPIRGCVGISRMLSEVGIRHQDLHAGNLVILNRKVQIIDFEYSTIK